MKKSYLWQWPLAMLSLLLGLHIMFTIAPIQNEYKAAVNASEVVQKDNEKTTGVVQINYSYEDLPNMGSKYGADVSYRTDKGSQIAWIAMDKPVGISQPIEIIYNEDIPNFALNAKNPILPHEIPSETTRNIALGLIILPFFYIGFEIFRRVNSRGNKDGDEKYFTVPDPSKLFGVSMLVALWVFLTVAPSISSFMDYTAAGERITAVRKQGNIVFANLSEKCADRQGEECDNRYKALYTIEGQGNFNRLFQVKGDIITDSELKAYTSSNPAAETHIPLLYNIEDPRFSYALSSSEQVLPPYNAFKVISGGVMLSFMLPGLLDAFRQKRNLRKS